MRGALFGLLLVGCSSDPGATGPVEPSVLHYDYKLDLDARSAHSKVTLVAGEAGNCVTLPFRAASIANVLWNGEPADATQTDTDITVCGGSVDIGDSYTIESDVTIALKTLSSSQVGFSESSDAQSNHFDYMVSWVNGCDQFGPCDSRPDQFATYTFDVTHAAAMMVRCSGDITEPSATETICDFKYKGGPTYSTFGLAAYPAWTPTDKGTWAGVNVTVYDRASTGIAAAIDPTWHTGFLSWMQSEFGPYPFGSDLRVLTAPTYWDGFEHPGNIVLDDNLAREKSYTNPVQHVLDHEMTHMWAGDQTTIKDTYDFVWKESMAEYLSFVYEDMNDAATSLQTSNVWKIDSKAAKYYPVPLDKPALFDYYGDVYGPGPMVLFRQLEVLSSRDKVLAAIQSVLGQQRALTVDEVTAALQTSTGLDLTKYIAGWIKGSGVPGWPTAAITFTPGATDSTLAVNVSNATDRGCKFHVALSDGTAANTTKIEFNTFVDGPQITHTLPTPAYTVSSIVLDPDHECLVFPSGLRRSDERARGWRSGQ